MVAAGEGVRNKGRGQRDRELVLYLQYAEHVGQRQRIALKEPVITEGRVNPARRTSVQCHEGRLGQRNSGERN